MSKRERIRPRPTPEREERQVPLAELKDNLSRYVRDVQTRGRSITITHHGRVAAVLAPAVAPRPALTVREPLDARPLGALSLRPKPGQGASAEAILRAIDQERGE